MACEGPFKKGDVLRITHVFGVSKNWIGLECEVIADTPDEGTSPHLRPLTRRPDGHAFHPFQWSKWRESLERVLRPPKFKSIEEADAWLEAH